MNKTAVERWLEAGLFASRWLLAPFYLGLVFALLGLLVVFARELYGEFSHVLTMRPQDGILMALSLIDLSLAGNLVIIVILSGYENFVAKIATPDRADRPDWLGGVDFSGLKMKVMASIVAISAIALLRAFMDLAEPDTTIDRSKLVWLIAIHLTFVISAVLLAAMDWLISRGKVHQGGAA